jgi:glycosyltransferase involved in cell wall biosynthesis
VLTIGSRVDRKTRTGVTKQPLCGTDWRKQCPLRMFDLPEISVILPSFNRTAFLRAAVESVRAQSHSDWELIVADDGSDKATREYLREIEGGRIRTLLLPHSGNPARVRNAAIEIAGGRYLAFLFG